MSPLGRLRTAVVTTVAAVALVAVATGTWTALTDRGGRSPGAAEAAVAEFFDARREGDCERLLDVLSQASWSDGGRLGREEFLTACGRVVDHHRPVLRHAELVSQQADRAVVRVSVPPGDDDRDLTVPPERDEGTVIRESPVTEGEADRLGGLGYAEGHLVWENDGWKVELDAGLLRLGRSAEDTVWEYVVAFRDGDCDRLARYVSEEAWSTEGGLDQDQLVAHCEAAADTRRAAIEADELGAPEMTFTTRPRVGMPAAIDVTPGSDEHRRLRERQGGGEGPTGGPTTTTAVVRWNSFPSETVTLVRQHLEWRLATSTLEPIRYADLAARLVDEPLGLPTDSGSAPSGAVVHADGASPDLLSFGSYEGDDATEHRRDAGFVRGLAATYGEHPRRVELLLYEFEDADGARRYAEHLAGRVVAVATRYRDIPSVPIPDVPAAVAIVTECAGADFRHASTPADCSRGNRATVVAPHDRFVVAVEAVDFEGEAPSAEDMRNQPVEVLRAQLAEL